ncbi:MAG: hypothetical protein C5B51_26625 [Terriglobia bacterium]|nr:MAG: hypothetical protein C5B51_26625 [Terriglobia bacterium]
MEVHLTPETEKKLKELSAQSGRGTDDVIEDAVAGYFKSGRVKPIDGEEAFARLIAKTEAERNPPA